MPSPITLTGVAGTLPLPGIATVAAAGAAVTTSDQQVTAQQLLNQDATLGAHLDGTAYTDILKMNGRKALNRPRVVLSDAAHTVKVTDGDRFQLPDPASPRIITLSDTSPTPAEGERIEFIMPVISGPDPQYTFKRADATIIATAGAPTVATNSGRMWVEFEYVKISTGPDVFAWKLGRSSGDFDDGGAPSNYGITPGAGA